MGTTMHPLRTLALCVLAATGLALAGCNDSSSGDTSRTGNGGGTGSVGLLFTDAPTDEFDGMIVHLRSVSLLPADDGDHVSIFEGEESFDLLALENYTDLFAFAEEVPAGDYSKVRLRVDGIDLVNYDEDGEISRSVPARVVANGKVDLNPRGPLRVETDETLLLRLDMDARRSVQVTRAGASGMYIFRPVVFVDVARDVIDDRLIRVHGEIDEVDPGAGELRLCRLQRLHSDSGIFHDGCVTVALDTDGAIFSADDGRPIDIANVDVGERATALGRFSRVNGERRLDALLVQLGGRSAITRLSGFVHASPEDGTFQMVPDPGQGLVIDNGPLAVELQEGTAVIRRDGTRVDPAEVLVPGTPVRAEGVLALSAEDGDALRASLVLVLPDTPDLEVLQRAEVLSVDADTRTLVVFPEDGTADLSVHVPEGADIFLVSLNEDDGTSSEAVDFEALEAEQLVDLYGATREDGVFEAETVIINAVPAAMLEIVADGNGGEAD